MKSTRVLATAGLSLGLAMALQSGCAQNSAVKQAPTAKLEATPPNAETAVAAQEEPLVGVSGKVVETLQAGGYTYVNVEKDGKKTWAAMSANYPAKAGDEISLKPGMVMKNFNSKSLNRSFEAIVFSDGPVGQESGKQHMTGLDQAAAPAAPQAPSILSGKIVETMDAGGYTYLNLEKDGKSSWVAIPATKVSVGQQVEVKPGMPMPNFTSKTLNRTFERIDFSSGLVTEGGSATGAAGTPSALPAGHPQTGATGSGALPAGHPQTGAKTEDAGKGAAPAAAEKPKKSHSMMSMGQPGGEMVAVSGKVVEAKDAGGYTYVQLDNAGKKVWAAIPNTQVTVGQELKLQPGNEMRNFTSKSLNKTFDSVIFSSGIANN